MRYFGSVATSPSGSSSTSAAISSRLRTTTAMSKPNASSIAFSTSRPTLPGDVSAALSATLPLCTYVLTSWKPAASSAARSSPIGTLLWPPTLMPRRSAMCRVIGRGALQPELLAHDARHLAAIGAALRLPHDEADDHADRLHVALAELLDHVAVRVERLLDDRLARLPR